MSLFYQESLPFNRLKPEFYHIYLSVNYQENRTDQHRLKPEGALLVHIKIKNR
ncbi:hypothetical protein HMPREF1548_00598 [Clostridium sp. KLE 1755]|nr:hypothetical protein HMPREF1548_00598 [Clostridium sp. KLE 1755]